MRQYTLEELKNLPTLAQGQTDDLKVQEGDTRIWLSRFSKEDGEPYDNKVSVEVRVERYVPVKRYDYRSGKKGFWESYWTVIREYQAI